ncbi:super-infection exclusion protein B [Aromatoleum evansii]|uniref:super-infection exclusion protein B n=1 Tax=Aromatoleum evansii TaxID=59406 RepID=UPI00145F8EA9|nr:hypothetical protein [Aromatoleum evansii]
MEWRSAKRRKKNIITLLSGLPPESKAVLIDFYEQGTHTRRTDPGDPAVRVLVSSGFLLPGPGGGTYDAIDSYLTIKSNIWEVMDDWVVMDATSIAMVREKFFEKPDHDFSSIEQST